MGILVLTATARAPGTVRRMIVVIVMAVVGRTGIAAAGIVAAGPAVARRVIARTVAATTAEEKARRRQRWASGAGRGRHLRALAAATGNSWLRVEWSAASEGT